MIVTLHYRNDATPTTLPAVQGIRLVAGDVVEVQTFGNAPALNRGVVKFDAHYDAPGDRFHAEPTSASGEPTNDARAARIEHAIRAYAVSCFGLSADQEDTETVVKDFLTDLYHWAAREQLDVQDLSARAMTMFEAEQDDERTASK